MKELSGETGRFINKLKFSKNKVTISFNDSTSLTIYKDTYLEFSLFINKFVDDSLFIKIKEFDEYVDVLKYSLNLIKKYTYSSNKLRNKLISKKYKKELIDKTIKYLNEHNLLNDEELAKEYLLTYINRLKGPLYIKNKLYEHGFTSIVINKTLDLYINEEEILKKNIKPLINKYKDKNKIINYLLRKGFEYNKIINILKEHYDIH